MRKTLSLLSLCLAVLLLLAPVSAAAEPLLTASAPPASVEDRLDYTLANGSRATLSPSALLEAILLSVGDGEAPSPEELAYLDDYFEEDLFYSPTVPASCISVTVTPEGVRVIAEPYIFIGENGRTVTRTPVSARCGEKEIPLDGSLTAFFEGATEADRVLVSYGGSLSLPASVANRILTFAYRDAETARGSLAALDSYREALQRYQDYLRAKELYDVQRESYVAYLSALSRYEAAYASYLQNRKELAEYPAKKQAYDEYVAAKQSYDTALATYQTDYAAYKTNADAYNAYINNLSAIRAALHTVESIFYKPEALNDLFTALQNAELIAMFEKYQGLLSSNFGVPTSDIHDLRVSSDRLNDLLGLYAEARAVGEAEALACYHSHYAEICRLFNFLYDKMTSILTPMVYNLICAKLDLEYGNELGSYKKWRIKNVLSHIYLICYCLDDSRSAEGTWSFFADNGDPHIYYFGDLLDQQLIITDTNSADPKGLSWIPPVEQPDPPALPKEPVAVPKPIQPVEQPEPTKPAEVAKPTPPTPADRPVAPDESDRAMLLRTQSLPLDLPLRNGVNTDPVISLPLSVTECALTQSGASSAVYDANGALLSTLSVNDLPSTLSAPSDAAHDYEFLGWSLSPNEPMALPDVLPEGSCVYPLFEAKARTYEITFRVNGVNTVCRVPYGETPVFDGDTQKPSSEQYDYSFTTWSPAPKPARQSMTYVAQYEPTDRLYTVTFDLKNRVVTRQYGWYDLPECPVLPTPFIQDGYLYEFLRWNTVLFPVERDTTYIALYHTVPLASLPGLDTAPDLTLSATGYTVSVTGSAIRLEGICDLTLSEGGFLMLNFVDHGVSVRIDPVALTAFSAHNSVVLTLLQGNGVGFLLTDTAGNPLSQDEGIRLYLPHGFEKDENLYVDACQTDGTLREEPANRSEGGITEILALPGVLYTPVRKYKLTLTTDGNGVLLAPESLYAEGAAISLTVRPHANHRLSALHWRDPVTGVLSDAGDPASLRMPSAHAELVAEFLPITYCIEFLYHGGSSTSYYRFGDTVEIPALETSFEEDGFFYTFIGWSSPVTHVTGDAVYTAKYYSVRIEEVSISGEGGAIVSAFLRLGLPLLGGVLLLATAVTLPLILIKKKKKKRNDLS